MADEIIIDFVEVPELGGQMLDHAWIRFDEVQAYRWYPGNNAIDIWFRHREKPVTFPCDYTQAKAFELALKTK